MKPKIKIRLVEKKGEMACHRGHRVGDVFDFDTERGLLCPMALHAGFPFIDILRYGGKLPPGKKGDIRFCCPDADVLNIFRLEPETEKGLREIL